MRRNGARRQMAAALIIFSFILALSCRRAAEPTVAFERIIIDENGPVDPWLKAVGDLNGNGRPDLVAGGRTSGGLVWYENPGWKQHVISAEGEFSTDGEVVDINGNGRNDIVAITTKGLVWFESPSWTLHPIGTDTLHDVEVADLDGDGKLDMVGRDQGAFKGRGDQLHFYRQESPTSWTHRVLPLPTNGEGLQLADIDGDGDLDIVIDRYWLENNGDILNGEWRIREYGKEWTHPHTFVATGDINGDGRLDIVLAPAERAGQTYRISWFEAPPDPKSGEWVEHVIDPSVECVHHFVGVADFNNDSHLDVATAEMHQGQTQEVRIYLNHGAGKTWSKHVIADSGSHSMRIVDVDGDGSMGLYGANWRGHVIDLWRNVTGAPGAR